MKELYIFIPIPHSYLDILYSSDERTVQLLEKKKDKEKETTPAPPPKKKKREREKKNIKQRKKTFVVYTTGVRKWTDFHRYICCFLYIEVSIFFPPVPLTDRIGVLCPFRQQDVYWLMFKC